MRTMPALVSSLFLSAFAAGSAAAASLSGWVAAPDGTQPLANQSVTLYAYTDSIWGPYWDYQGNTYTDFTGGFAFPDLPAGMYAVRYDGDWEFPSMFYPTAIDFTDAPALLLGAEDNLEGIEFITHVGGVIEGRVEDENGDPLEGIEVTPFPYLDAFGYGRGFQGDYGRMATTDPDGRFRITGLSPVATRLEFHDALNHVYASAAYVNALSAYDDAATSLPVAAGATNTITMVMVEGATVSGTVTESDGTTPAEQVWASLFIRNPSGSTFSFNFAVQADGTYQASGIPPGDYRVEFYEDYSTLMRGYLREYYDGVFLEEDARVVSVTSGVTVTGIDARMDFPGTISGTVTEADGVTGIPGVWMVAELDGHPDWTWAARTDASGHYSIEGLFPGSYRVRTSLSGTSRFLGEWYPNEPITPGQVDTPAGAQMVIVNSGQESMGMDLMLDQAASLNGRVTVDGDFPISSALIWLEGQTYGQYRYAFTDANGEYRIPGVYPDTYLIKASAADLADVWWPRAEHRDDADPYVLAAGTEEIVDFELQPGQSPALVNITSDPAGADIFIDYHPTGLQTPSLVDIGEAPYASHGTRTLSHRVTVRLAGHPLPVPQGASESEAETEQVHFDLTSSDAGSVEVVTTPAGAEVYVDRADAPAGVSPVTLTGLAPGSHVVLLRKAGFLLPRPLNVVADTSTVVRVELPLAAAPSADSADVSIRTIPPAADIYLDYLGSASVSDLQTRELDPASHAGAGWHSTEHVILARKAGYRAPAPRIIDAFTNGIERVVIVLGEDPADRSDDDVDGLADEWEDAYDLDTFAPGQSGPDDDPDGDGARNEDERRAGTDPTNRDSLLGTLPVSGVDAGTALFHYVFQSVPNLRYVVQCTADLTDARAWVTISPVLVAEGEQTEFSSPLPADGLPRCYRAVLVGR